MLSLDGTKSSVRITLQCY